MKGPKSGVRIISIALFLVLSFSPLATGDALAETQPIDAIVQVSQKQVKAGDVLKLTATVRNMSDGPVTLNFTTPYLLFPEIKNQMTGAFADMESLPMDFPAQPKVIILKPNESYDIGNYTIYVLKDFDRQHPANDGELWNHGWLKEVPGLYSIKFSLSFAAISGSSSHIVVSHMQDFTIFTQESVENCQTAAKAIKPGMTRADVEAQMGHDGGLAGLFKGERLLFTVAKPGEALSQDWMKQPFCMLMIDFRPYGMSDVTYSDTTQFAEWTKRTNARPDPRDVVSKISPAFIDYMHSD